MLSSKILKNNMEFNIIKGKEILKKLINTLNYDRGISDDEFSIILIPDTQGYSKKYPASFKAQTKWIVENQDLWNIVYVAHEGDIVNTSSSIQEWDNAYSAITILEKAISENFPDGIPYSVTPGNWDMPTINYNTYFGAHRYIDRSYYGGVYNYPQNDDNFILFTAGNIDFIAISLSWEFDDNRLTWADSLLKSHNKRAAIIVSHWILNYDGSFGQPGKAIYNALKENSNLFLLLCGHVATENMRMDTYNGNIVYSLLANYQNRPNGGNGWLRILQFAPSNDEIHVRTYSPVLDKWEKDSNSEFTLNFNF